MLGSLSKEKMDLTGFCRLCGQAGALVKAEGDLKQTIIEVLHVNIYFHPEHYFKMLILVLA